MYSFNFICTRLVISIYSATNLPFMMVAFSTFVYLLFHRFNICLDSTASPQRMFMKLRTGGIIPPVMAHFMANSGRLFHLLRKPRRPFAIIHGWPCGRAIYAGFYGRHLGTIMRVTVLPFQAETRSAAYPVAMCLLQSAAGPD